MLAGLGAVSSGSTGAKRPGHGSDAQVTDHKAGGRRVSEEAVTAAWNNAYGLMKIVDFFFCSDKVFPENAVDCLLVPHVPP